MDNFLYRYIRMKQGEIYKETPSGLYITLINVPKKTLPWFNSKFIWVTDIFV